MKLFYSVLIVCSFLNAELCAGGLFVKGSYAKIFHVAYETKSPEYLPQYLQSEKQIPGIGQYFNDGDGFIIGLSYVFNNIEESNCHFMGNITYDNHSILSKSDDAAAVFGNKLKISSISAMIGLGFDKGNPERPVHLYINCGPVLNYTHGTGSSDGINMEFDFENSVLFRIMAGLDIPIITSRQGISLSASYDLGNIDRGKVNYYYNSNWLARAKPTGDQSINDDRFSLMVGLFFRIL